MGLTLWTTWIGSRNTGAESAAGQQDDDDDDDDNEMSAVEEEEEEEEGILSVKGPGRVLGGLEGDTVERSELDAVKAEDKEIRRLRSAWDQGKKSGMSLSGRIESDVVNDGFADFVENLAACSGLPHKNLKSGATSSDDEDESGPEDSNDNYDEEVEDEEKGEGGEQVGVDGGR